MIGQGRGARSARALRKTPRGVARKLKRLAAAAFVAIVAFATVPVVAQAAMSDYTVPGVTPNGTTINLFDYWLTTQGGADNSDPYDANNAGINDGHSLKFRAGGAGIDNSTAGDEQQFQPSLRLTTARTASPTTRTPRAPST